MITSEMKQKFEEIHYNKMNKDESKTGYYSIFSRKKEMEELNTYLISLGIEDDELLSLISEYNDIYYFNDFDSTYLNASYLMDMVDGFIYDENLNSILGISNLTEENLLNLKSIKTESDELDYEIKKLNYRAKLYSSHNTFSKEKDLTKTNYRILSNKIDSSKLRETSLSYVMTCLNSLIPSSNFEDLPHKKVFLLIDSIHLKNILLKKDNLDYSKIKIVDELKKNDYNSNDFTIINSSNQNEFFNLVKKHTDLSVFQNLLTNYNLTNIKNNEGFKDFLERKSKTNHINICVNNSGEILTHYEYKTLSEYKKLKETLVEDLISIYHNENNEKNISDEVFKSLRSAIESKILKEDILLYNIKIPSFIQEIKNKIKGNKTGLEFNRKLAKEVLLNKEINYVENFLEKLETIGDIDKLISLFQNEILYYKKEIEFIENNIEIKSDLTKKEIIYINKFFQKNLNKESQDLLMMIYADSGNELYEALVSDIPRFKSSIYITKNLLMKFIEEINSYLEIDIEKINLIQYLNKKELLRF